MARLVVSKFEILPRDSKLTRVLFNHFYTNINLRISIIHLNKKIVIHSIDIFEHAEIVQNDKQNRVP